MSLTKPVAQLKQLSLAYALELQRILEAAPAYWLRITGELPGNLAAEETFRALPDGKSHDDKFVLGIFVDAELVGCADLVRGYPDSETAMLGLLLLRESHQHMGLGRSAYLAIENFVRSWKQITRMRIGVVAANDSVHPFWKNLGFVETGLRRPYQEGAVVSETIVLEKPLLRAPVQPI